MLTVLESIKLSTDYLDKKGIESPRMNAELLLAESGIGIVQISGADIYNGKCIACHQFDKKVVGPPYKETLPKYEGKMDELIKFISNPVKINAEYPAMPNQGLKPNEAKAIAEYIMATYKTK